MAEDLKLGEEQVALWVEGAYQVGSRWASPPVVQVRLDYQKAAPVGQVPQRRGM